MLAASGCHKDSFNFDEFTRPTTTTPDDGTGLPPSTRTPNVGITTDVTSASERGQIGLTVTSDEMAPAGGLAVMINIGVAMAGEFTSANCTGLVCTVTIPEGMTTTELILMPTSDSATENSERWTATLVDGSDYNLDAGNNDVAFDITDPLSSPPTVMNDRTIAELNAYDTPTALAANAIRAGNDEGGILTITGFCYDDADGNPQVYVQKQQNLAHLGIWTSGQIPTVNEFDHDFRYAFLGDNAVTSRSTSDTAIYLIEGDATYKGVNFFLDGSLDMDFAANTYTGRILATDQGMLNQFGSDTAMLPDGSGGMRAIADDDDLFIFLRGTLTADGFTGTPTIRATGFFADLAAFTSATFSGRFYHSTGYDPIAGDPSEIAGAGVIVNGGGMNDLHFGIIGRCVIECAAGEINSRTLADLNAYDTPTALAASAIRNLQSDAIDSVAITASRYDDASSNPQIYVQMLEFAALGVWVNGNTPEIGVFDHDYNYGFLGDNAVTPPPNSGTAIYGIEGDATYKGVNFFPDGTLTMDFTANTYTGNISADGGDTVDDFGSVTAMLPDGSGGMRAIANDDDLIIDLQGSITADGFRPFFTSPVMITATGFFADLTRNIRNEDYSGRFYNSAGASGDPSEIAGAGEITHLGDFGVMNDLYYGFVGRCIANCAAGD